ncbi:MAG: putative zinc-binding metallopeptidase [Flavobacteriaceae bacterium]|jgi:substrate import-associated zinc metallohydrolase lipoprotein|nr:putative zinc-binding metallopeptidase [Flavobacteriaceae bacterium]
MKKTVINVLAIFAIGIAIVSCEKEDKLSNNSVLTKEDPIMNSTDMYLASTFTDPYNMTVSYRWDRNQYGTGKDVARNLYPAKLVNVKPALEMVDKVWLKTYEEVAGKDFVKKIRPGDLLIAGGYAFNDDGTRTLGLASGGVQITLYETDFLGGDVFAARQFIHTIQHEYIHIINQTKEFSELEFGKNNRGSYTSQWYELPQGLNGKRDVNGNPWNIDSYGNILGFITGYSRSNTFEDFAETASVSLAKTPAEIQAIFKEIKKYEVMTDAERAKYGLTPDVYKAGGVEKIQFKLNFVKEYFKSECNIDFDQLVKVANKNAAESPMLNRGGENAISVFGNRTINSKNVVRYCQSHANVSKEVKL